MGKFLAKVERKHEGPVKRSVVLLNDKQITFGSDGKRSVFLHEGVKYDLEIYCYGDRNAKSTVSIKRKAKDLLTPLVCDIRTDLGATYAHRSFKP